MKWQRSLNSLIEDAKLDLKSHFRTHINQDRFEQGSNEYNEEAEKWISHTKVIADLTKKMNEQKKDILKNDDVLTEDDIVNCETNTVNNVRSMEVRGTEADIVNCETNTVNNALRSESPTEADIVNCETNTVNNALTSDSPTEADIVNCEVGNTVNNAITSESSTEADIVNCETNTVNNASTMEVITEVDIVNCEVGNTVNNESIREDSFSSNPPQEDTVSLLDRPLKKSRVQETSCSSPDRFITIKRIDGRFSFKTRALLSRERKKRRDESILLLHRLNDSFLIRADFAMKTSGFKVQVFNTFNNRITDGAVTVIGSVVDFKWKILFNELKIYIYTDSTTFYEIYDCYSSQKYYHLNLSISACT